MKTKITHWFILLFIGFLGLNVPKANAQCNADFTFSRNTLMNMAFFTNTSTPNFLLYTWKFGDNTTSNLKNPSKIYAKADTFLVCLYVRDTLSTCFDTVCKPLYLTQQAACNASFFDSVYPTDPTQFKRFVPHAISSNKTYRWTFGDASSPQWSTIGTHTYNSPGTYNVCLYVSSGYPDSCFNTYCKNVVVGFPSKCTSTITKIPDPNNPYKRYYSANNPDTFVTFKWSFYNGDSSAGKNTFKNYPGSGIYKVCLKAKKAFNGDTCEFNICIDDTIQTPCKAAFTFAKTSSSNPKVFTFSCTTSNIIATWNFDDGTSLITGNPITHSFPIFRSYNVCLYTRSTIDTTCRDTLCKTVQIRDTLSCNAAFQIYFTDSNNNKKVTLIPKTIIDSSANYLWTFSDSSTGNSFMYNKIFSSFGYQRICLQVSKISLSDTCYAQVCDSVYIGCKSKFSFTRSSSQPRTITFTSSSSMGLPLNYLWTIGSTIESTQSVFTKTFLKGGNQLVCLTVRSRTDTTCVNTSCQTVFIPCISSFSYKIDSINNQSISFQSTVQADTSTQYLWNFGDGNTSTLANPTHIFANGGFFNVCLTITQANYSCSNTKCDSVFVGGAPCRAYFVPNMTLFPTVNFLNLSQGSSSTKYQWSFGDGSFSTQRNPIHSYLNDTTFRVCLTMIDTLNPSCADTFCRFINEDSTMNNCRADFSNMLDSLYSGPGIRMYFSARSMYTSPNVQYLWTFGDGDTSTAKNPSHIYATSGNYNVCLSIIHFVDSCYKTDCRTIQVTDTLVSGINSLKNEGYLHTYPNPFDKFIQMEVSFNSQGNWTYELIDIQGRVAQAGNLESSPSQGVFKIATSDIQKGVYVLQVKGNNQTYRKIMVK